MSDDADDDDLALPEANAAPPETPGSASWGERTGDGAPPYEESLGQLIARWRARLAAMGADAREVRLEARRKRMARIAQRRDAAAERAAKARLDQRWRSAP